jgi:long-subunit acyl-CoA synthetase (AMP-forming)
LFRYGSALTLTDQSPKLQKGTKGDAPTLRPTIIAAVPAIMDRIRDSVNAKISQAGFPVSTLYKIAYKSRLAALESGFEGLGIMKVGRLSWFSGSRVVFCCHRFAPFLVLVRKSFFLVVSSVFAWNPEGFSGKAPLSTF